MEKADIVVVGCGAVGRTTVSRLEEINSSLSVVVESEITKVENRFKKTFEITRPPELPSLPIIDKSEFRNEHKHKMTCAKNRKKRKRRKRNR